MENSEMQKTEHIDSVLFQSFISGDSLNHLVELSAKLLGNPIIVIDLSYNIVANSPLCDVSDAFWVENIKKGYCPYDFIARVNALPSVKQGKKSDGAYEVFCNESNNVKLVSKIYANGLHIGNAILLGCKSEIQPDDFELMETVSKMLGQKMKRNSYYTSSNEIIREDFIFDLLENKYRFPEEILDKMKLADISFEKVLCVLVFDISRYESDETSVTHLKENFTVLFHVENSVYYNENIVVIFDKSKLPALTEKIENFLSLHHVRLGISRDFSNLSQCRKYYQQAVTALQLGSRISPQENIIDYYKVQYYSLLTNIDAKNEYHDLCHPALLVLKEYDKAHHSNLYDTLYTYILNDGNIQKTASDLFMHRNTVRYKINRITELIHIDFSNIREISNIFISFRISKYLETEKGCDASLLE